MVSARALITVISIARSSLPLSVGGEEGRAGLSEVMDRMLRPAGGCRKNGE